MADPAPSRAGKAQQKWPLGGMSILGDAELNAVGEVLACGELSDSLEVEAFEAEAAQTVEASHAVALASSGAALLLALRALDLGSHAEVIVPTLAPGRLGAALRGAGLKPAFVDCEATSGAAAIEDAERLVGPDTRAVVLVNDAGRPHDRLAWDTFAHRHRLKRIVHAGSAIGAHYSGSALLGADGTAEVTVFDLNDPGGLSTGEGGLVTMSDTVLARRLRALREGVEPVEEAGVSGPGVEARMTAMQAALGRAQLRRMHDLLSARASIFDRWHGLLTPVRERVERPLHPASSGHTRYEILVPDSPDGALRDALLERLAAVCPIQERPPVLLHRLAAFRSHAPEEPLVARAVRRSRRLLTLPSHPALTVDVQERIAGLLVAALEASGAEDRARARSTGTREGAAGGGGR